MKKYIIKVDGQRNLAFTGEEIANASTRNNLSTRWFVLTLYKTKGENYIAQRQGYSQWQGEETNHEAKKCETDEQVVEYFGLSEAAKDLYDQAGIIHETDVD